MNGILAVWKPAGWTSHDVVAKARRLLRTKRIGHAGTLDPEVTGVLPLCIGRATRVVEYMQELPKAYEAVLQFGVSTDTEDLTGTVTETALNVSLTEEQVRNALDSFVGEIEQVPPMYSAVRVDGKRLYELAREGKVVERKKRKATIHEIQLLSLDLEAAHPRITFHVTCSKGTYIRTLCVDIGKALGVPAAMASLKRTLSAGLTEADCLTLEQIEQLQGQNAMIPRLLPVDAVLNHMDKLTVNHETAVLALQGKKLAFDDVTPKPSGTGLTRLYNEDQTFLGIYEKDFNSGLIRPVKVFSPVES
ncbi:tRNA pseudouridine(55) synthase TruB [Paenibacillus abyssi]|uniref:tRNA pseudouridine synthase B n=1 Tax=Paenibacillus abyssi TaxID=1340531 RepID=A0A917FVD2_9BACL|nr:tRNA pseudouridine(55) synthase TruB [Paenibacillus abyssi]GGG12008.1 tRNA pseudouridine synthase B [Paenibacillus abyssi]